MQLAADGTRQISLTRAQFEAINHSLGAFFKQTKCAVVMVSDSSGLSVAMKGSKDPSTMALLSTLAAGNYVATGEIARLLQEESSFKGQFHEGKTQSIYLKGINDDFFLTIVFGKHITFAMIKVLTDKMIEELKVVVDAIEEVPTNSGASMPAASQTPDELRDGSFQSELSSKLDEILGKF